MAKRGYTRDTIRGGASDWDVSRPFTSYFRLLATLVVHPVRFFDVLPKVPDLRAPGLFLTFCGVLAAIAWLVADGAFAAIIALLSPLPLCFALAGLYHLAAGSGRYGYLVTWRVVAYPLGFYLPLSVAPVLWWVAGIYAGALLVGLGLAVAQEVSAARAAIGATLVTALVLAVAWWLF